MQRRRETGISRLPSGISLSSLLSVPRNLSVLLVRMKATVDILEAVAEFGEGLRTLAFWPYIAHREALTNMFQVVGSTNESLNLGIQDQNLPGDTPAFDLKQTARLCPRVTSIALFGVSLSMRQDEFEMYCMYGTSLKEVSLHDAGTQFHEASLIALI